jgi:hypothetical protein
MKDWAVAFIAAALIVAMAIWTIRVVWVMYA